MTHTFISYCTCTHLQNSNSNDELWSDPTLAHSDVEIFDALQWGPCTALYIPSRVALGGREVPGGAPSSSPDRAD